MSASQSPDLVISRRGLIKALGVTAAASVLGACANVEGTGRSQLMLVSAEQAAQLGNQAFAEIKQKERPATNPKHIAMMKRLAQRLIPQAPHRSHGWEFHLFESDVPNAFALPGGKVALYTGILPMCATEAGAAAVVGHEMAHIIANHGGERMSQQLAGETILSLSAAGLQAANVDETTTAIAVAALGAGTKVGVLLPYSRVHETEADNLGTRYMAAAGYDPNAAVKLWQNLATNSQWSQAEWLSTHPSHSSRVSDLQANMVDFMARYEAAGQQYGMGERL